MPSIALDPGSAAASLSALFPQKGTASASDLNGAFEAMLDTRSTAADANPSDATSPRQANPDRRDDASGDASKTDASANDPAPRPATDNNPKKTANDSKEAKEAKDATNKPDPADAADPAAATDAAAVADAIVVPVIVAETATIGAVDTATAEADTTDITLSKKNDAEQDGDGDAAVAAVTATLDSPVDITMSLDAQAANPIAVPALQTPVVAALATPTPGNEAITAEINPVGTTASTPFAAASSGDSAPIVPAPEPAAQPDASTPQKAPVAAAPARSTDAAGTSATPAPSAAANTPQPTPIVAPTTDSATHATSDGKDSGGQGANNEEAPRSTETIKPAHGEAKPASAPAASAPASTNGAHSDPLPMFVLSAPTVHVAHSNPVTAAEAGLDASAASIPVPIAGVAIEIAARAQAGINRFEIRLDPPELGRIDVRLDVDRNGNVHSRLVVERAETLDMLRRDAPQLERALEQAGLKTGDSSLHFSLRDQSAAEGERDNREGRLPNAARLVVPDDDAASAEVARGYGRFFGLGGGVDIRV